MFDVKLTRPTVQSIIAGPYKTEDEAQMHATRYTLQEREAREAKLAQFEKDFPPLKAPSEDPEEDEEYRYNRKKEEKELQKFLAETESVFTVVKHKRGGI